MTYQVGDKLCLNTVGEMRVNRYGRNFIMVTDDQSQYPVHNILKCQYEDFPEFLHVIVTEVDVYGRPSFIQDFPAVFAHHYHKGERKIVDITSTGVDDDKRYYLVEDDFAEHRFYTDKEYPIGESILIEIIGFTKKGFLYFKEVTNNPDSVSTSIASTPSPRARQTRLILGPENIELERKSSIVFTAANSEPNIQDQMIVICKELAAFMNTEGGCLVIGVTDKDDVVKGIESDYPYLNTDPDYTDRTYHQDEDGYRLKILDVVNYRCGSFAASTLRFDFKEKEGKHYLKINVKKAERPVWVKEGGKGAVLYIRQDGRCKTIYGDELTNYIVSRMNRSINPFATEEILAQFEERVKQLLNQREASADIVLPEAPTRDTDWWLVWFNDGTFVKQRNASQSTDVYFQMPIYRNRRDLKIIFCYDDARIVTADAAKLLPGRQEEIQDSVWKDGKKPMSILLAYANDYIAIRSVDSNGHFHTKLHHVGQLRAVNVTNRVLGQSILPDQGYTIQQYAAIGSEHSNQLNHMVLDKDQWSRSAGDAEPILKPDLRDYLHKLLGLI